MSRLRRATTKSFSGKTFCPSVLFNFTLASVLFAGGSFAFGADDQSGSPLLADSLSNPISGSGLVLPISAPIPLAAHQRDLLPDSSFSPLSDGLGAVPVEPIPVPLPPGVATGMIGLVAAAIARHRWKLRRA